MQLSIGPSSIASLMIASTMQNLDYGNASPTEYIDVVGTITIVAGIILILMGLARFGVLTNFLSNTVLSGFTTGSAIYIGISQLKYIFGYEHMPSYPYIHQFIYHVLKNLGSTNLTAFAIGVATFSFLLFIRIWKQKNKPSPERNKSIIFRIAYGLTNFASIIALFFGIIIAYIIISRGGSIPVVGVVPPGFQSPIIPGSLFQMSVITKILPSSVMLAVVSFMNNWVVAAKYANLNKYEVDANRELIASGMSNFAGGFFNCFVVAGGLSRSAVNADCGAKTPMAGIITATLVLISLFTLTKVFYYIPMATLGAVIQVSVIPLIDFDEILYAYKVDREDFMVIVCTVLVTIFVAPTSGIVFGLFLSIVVVVNEVSFPNIVHLGLFISGDSKHYYKDFKRYSSKVQQHPKISIIRMDAPLFFANCAGFKKFVMDTIAGKFPSQKTPIDVIVIDFSSCLDIDLTGLRVLNDIHEELVKLHIQLSFANTKGPVKDRLLAAHFVQKLGDRFLYSTIDDAISDQAIRQRRNSIEQELNMVAKIAEIRSSDRV
jgi:sulfate permease, SulP family